LPSQILTSSGKRARKASPLRVAAAAGVIVREENSRYEMIDVLSFDAGAAVAQEK
jgi:hypothetical protein